MAERVVEPVPKAEELPAGATAFIQLMQELLNGGLICGEAVRETKIAAKLGLSRAAIREGLNQLVNLELMEYMPYRGYRLRNFTLCDMLDWCELREAIEPMAARRLAQYRPLEVLHKLEEILVEEEKSLKEGDKAQTVLCDHNFHLTMVGECGNRRLGVFYFQSSVMILALMSSGKVDGEIAEYQKLGKAFDNRMLLNDMHVRDAQLHHQKIFDYICDGDEAKAESTMREHISYQIGKIKNFMVGRQQQREREEESNRSSVSPSTIIKNSTLTLMRQWSATK